MSLLAPIDYSQLLTDKVQFFYVITKKSILFEWKKIDSFRNYKIMVDLIKTNTYNNHFFRFEDGVIRIISILKKNIVYAIGAKVEVQSQLVESLLDVLIEEFLETYDLDVLLTFDIVNSKIFKDFNSIFEELLHNFNDLKLVKSVKVLCNVCKKPFTLIIKKKIIKNSDTYPIPIVFNHRGHSIICYIDQDFKSRGTREVTFG